MTSCHTNFRIEGRQLCYYVPETLHNISERVCTKRQLRTRIVNYNYHSNLKKKNCFIVVNCFQIILRLNKTKNYICKKSWNISLPFLIYLFIFITFVIFKYYKTWEHTLPEFSLFEWESPIEATENIILFPVGFRLGLQGLPMTRCLCLTNQYLLNIFIE